MTGPTGPTKTVDRHLRDGASGGRSGSGSGTPPPVRRARRGPDLPSRRKVLVSLAVAAVLGGAAVWALYWSDWLRVEKVSASGARVLTEEQVLRAANIPEGRPVISVDREAAEKRLLEGLPRLARAEVVRAWPNGIGVKVTERRPELVIEKDGKYTEVDAEGVRFATAEKRPPHVPLLVMDLRSDSAEDSFSRRRLRREAVRVASALPAGAASETRTIRVRSYDSMTLELTGDRTVLWGSSEQGKAKASALTAVMKAAKGAERFDVSVPSAPAVSES